MNEKIKLGIICMAASALPIIFGIDATASLLMFPLGVEHIRLGLKEVKEAQMSVKRGTRCKRAC